MQKATTRKGDDRSQGRRSYMVGVHEVLEVLLDLPEGHPFRKPLTDELTNIQSLREKILAMDPDVDEEKYGRDAYRLTLVGQLMRDCIDMGFLGLDVGLLDGSDLHFDPSAAVDSIPRDRPKALFEPTRSLTESTNQPTLASSAVDPHSTSSAGDTRPSSDSQSYTPETAAFRPPLRRVTARPLSSHPEPRTPARRQQESGNPIACPNSESALNAQRRQTLADPGHVHVTMNGDEFQGGFIPYVLADRQPYAWPQHAYERQPMLRTWRDEDGYLNFVVVESDSSSAAAGRIPRSLFDTQNSEQFLEFAHANTPRPYRPSGPGPEHPRNRQNAPNRPMTLAEPVVHNAPGSCSTTTLPPAGSLLFEIPPSHNTSAQPWAYVETY
ncbi:hypothetical protein PUNSTDRAFT_143913 [Punctularia strigosozonata HHB-11173 SS5]|uniref:uncharacterized protein n=1 Tax=Punctularia strigosozonata (strain HHB-11173) TaxID=741275 RepID=UPI00044169A5|nr:uncharacterized protein PUNSTDRAFT_143913 [Punctularia strigosozonata HHB-11173 SS5]EIN08276.1 hypothetical protein PUNSTDRAFT_143913 [Punctularia strigosozonata HHB-11173 SS5]